MENTPTGGVQICVARDGFMPAQRRAFIQYLKSEGFIPEETRRVVWSFDPSWPYLETSEMDTAAVIARAPTVALVDELAHTNAPGSRTKKRYEDVEDLLEAGINVISTLNIQSSR